MKVQLKVSCDRGLASLYLFLRRLRTKKAGGLKLYLYILIALTVLELILFVLLAGFFRRLRRSEQLLTELRKSQSSILDKLELNAGLEEELMASFTRRQLELARLDSSLEGRAEALRKLLTQAEAVSRSPQFLREVIIGGSRRGMTTSELARNTGLSVDEVELILAQA